MPSLSTEPHDTNSVPCSSLDGSRIWIPELVERIASFLPTNVVACSLRPLSTTTAALFRGPHHTTVRLSQLSPHHAFARRWGGPGGARALTLEQRRQLLRLTAATGSTANLETTLCATDLLLTCDVFEAAAAAGQLGACRWLLRRGCPPGAALAAAAGAGQLGVCVWLLAAVLQEQPGSNAKTSLGNEDAVVAALRGGCCAGALGDWLQLLLPPLGSRTAATGAAASGAAATGAAAANSAAATGAITSSSAGSRGPQRESDAALLSGATHIGRALIAAAAYGCDLATLQWLWRGLRSGRWPSASSEGPMPLATDALPPPPPPASSVVTAAATAAGRLRGRRRYSEDAVAAAAASPSLDWREKVEWLEGVVDSPRSAAAAVCAAAASCPDAPARLAWLRQRGYPAGATATLAAAAAGNASALQYLLAAGVAVDRRAAAEAAAAVGCVKALAALRAGPGFDLVTWFVACAAAGGGHLCVLAWVEQEFGAAAPGLRCPHVFAEAARSGSVELLAWLRRRGCPGDAQAVVGAAAGGCEAALEWLLERGCPMPDSGEPYVCAARNGDLATLRCLRRLGCPWGPGTDVFTRCVYQDGEGGAALPALRWLAGEGCPVDWGAALRAAQRRRRRRDGGSGGGGGGEAAAVLSWLEGGRPAPAL